MAEENRFFQYPRIAWEAFDASKNSSTEQSPYRSSCKSKARYPLPHRYLSDPDIRPNYTELSKGKLLVQSTLSKQLHLTPRLTRSPEQGKFFPFGRVGSQKSSHTVADHQLTASVKAHQPTSQHTSSYSSSWVSAIREEGIPYLSAYLKIRKPPVITNLASCTNQPHWCLQHG